MQDDWRYLTDNLHIISSLAYFKQNGRPVVSEVKAHRRELVALFELEL
jgi:hypothetical protein